MAKKIAHVKPEIKSEVTDLVCTRSPRHLDLNDEEFYFLIGHIADPYYSNAMIAALFMEQTGKKMGPETVRKYRHAKSYQTLIAAIREQLANDIADIPIATKRHRLNALQQALNTALSKSDVDLRVDKEGGEHFLVREQPELVPGIVSQARREIEGDTRGGKRDTTQGGAVVALPPGFEGKISISQMIMADDQGKKETGSFIRERLKEALDAKSRTDA